MFGRFERTESAEQQPVERTGHGALWSNAEDRHHRNIDRADHAS